MSRATLLGVPAGQSTVLLRATRALRVHRRTMAVVLVLSAVVLLVGTFTLLTGAYEITSAEAARTLTGGGSELDRFIVLDQRLPRILAAAAIGAMLAVSGALFQSLSRNPLGSPDIVGFTTGATTGGLVAILLSAVSSSALIVTGSTVGGFLTAGAVLLIARRRGGGGDEVILAGIAISQMLSSTNDYLLTRATIEDAESARTWQYGSLNAVSWDQVIPLLCLAAVLLPAVLALAGPAGVLEMGDEAATSLGLRVGRLRALMVGAGVVLASVCVSVAGPIGFLALAAPQLARRLARSPGITLAASAAMGSALLVVADLLAQRLLSPFQIPVGLLSSACGGLYLVWLVGVRPREEPEA